MPIGLSVPRAWRPLGALAGSAGGRARVCFANVRVRPSRPCAPCMHCVLQVCMFCVRIVYVCVCKPDTALSLTSFCLQGALNLWGDNNCELFVASST